MLTVNWYWVAGVCTGGVTTGGVPPPVSVGIAACSTSIFIVSDNSPHPLVYTVDTVIELEPTSVIVPSILYLFPSIE